MSENAVTVMVIVASITCALLLINGKRLWRGYWKFLFDEVILQHKEKRRTLLGNRVDRSYFTGELSEYFYQRQDTHRFTIALCEMQLISSDLRKASQKYRLWAERAGYELDTAALDNAEQFLDNETVIKGVKAHLDSAESDGERALANRLREEHNERYRSAVDAEDSEVLAWEFRRWEGWPMLEARFKAEGHLKGIEDVEKMLKETENRNRREEELEKQILSSIEARVREQNPPR